MITDKAVNAVNPEFARILARWTKGVGSGVQASREAEQMCFGGSDFYRLTNPPRDVAPVFYDSDIAWKGGC